MDLGEQQLASRGVQRVVLEVNVANEIAISFYKGRGYVTQRTLRNYYRDRTDAYLMEKAL
jgi:ribosomal protein S18 acetylase RimI-like enzyme